MKLDFLEPRYLRTVGDAVLLRSREEFRHALDLLRRNPVCGYEELLQALEKALLLVEDELYRRFIDRDIKPFASWLALG